jgi:hypothetical protein
LFFVEVGKWDIEKGAESRKGRKEVQGKQLKAPVFP